MGKSEFLAILLLGLAPAANAQSIMESDKDETSVVLRTAEVTALGTYLTAQNGRAVYMFTADKGGKPTCRGVCAKDWAPVKTKSDVGAEEGVERQKIATVPSGDGEQQVTYAGHPLYYFIQDAGGQGATTGQAISSHSGMWYLLKPDGEPITAKRPGEFPNPGQLEQKRN